MELFRPYTLDLLRIKVENAYNEMLATAQKEREQEESKSHEEHHCMWPNLNLEHAIWNDMSFHPVACIEFEHARLIDIINGIRWRLLSDDVRRNDGERGEGLLSDVRMEYFYSDVRRDDGEHKLLFTIQYRNEEMLFDYYDDELRVTRTYVYPNVLGRFL